MSLWGWGWMLFWLTCAALGFMVSQGLLCLERTWRHHHQRRIKRRREAWHDLVRREGYDSWQHKQAVEQRKRFEVHDTWGKVYPTCQCEGCAKEREYVESRNMWTANILRNSERDYSRVTPIAGTDEAWQRSADGQHVRRIKTGGVDWSPDGIVHTKFVPLFALPGPKGTGPCSDCFMDTTRTDDGSQTGWRCESCAELLMAAAYNQAMWHGQPEPVTMANLDRTTMNHLDAADLDWWSER
jgi:hypothetical protein